jgi:hypothetical protein
MKGTRSVVHLALLTAAVQALSGCSFSASSESFADSSGSLSDSSGSVSDSVSASFKSSSDSSPTEREKYERDVRDYTAEFAKSSSTDLETFRVRVGRLAEGHGITNWEEDKSTYLAVGRGLRKANLSKPQYEAFKASLAGSQPLKMQYIEEGYE